MNRAEAVVTVGEENVKAVETLNCEMTNRVGFNGRCQDDDIIEWMSSFACKDVQGDPCTVYVYYYTDQDDEDIAESTEDWSMVTFTPHHYEVL